MNNVKATKVRQMQMMIHLLITSGTVMEVIYETIFTSQKILQLTDEELKELSPIEYMLFAQSLDYRKNEEIREYEGRTK